MAQGLPGSSGPGSRCCSGPCGSSSRWGGRAARRRRRSPCWPPPAGGRRRRPARSSLFRIGVGAGEQLVPGADAGPFPVDPQRHGGSEAARSAGSGSSSRIATSAGSRAPDRRDSAGAWSLRSDCDGRRDPGPVGPGEPLGRLLEEAGAFLQLQLHRLAGAELDGDLVPPGGQAVGPPLDDELVGADLGRLEDRLEAVVAQGLHGRRRPFALGAVAAPPADPGGQDVVPVAEDVGSDAAPAARPPPWPDTRWGSTGGCPS